MVREGLRAQFADAVTPTILPLPKRRRATTSARVVALEAQLSQARQSLQTTRDETRGSQEALNAA